MDWSYDAWPSGEPYEWGEAARATKWDAFDFHVDLGCGLAKKGRIGIDRFPAPGVNIAMEFEGRSVYALPREVGGDAVCSECDEELTMGHDPECSGDWRSILGTGLPFGDGEIKSIVSHHVLEHIGDGFPYLMDECHRVLEDGGIFRIIVPLFPSWGAVIDPDHRRFFLEGSFGHMLAYSDMGFAVPYVKGRWEILDVDASPRTHWSQMWTPEDQREMRVALKAVKS